MPVFSSRASLWVGLGGILIFVPAIFWFGRKTPPVAHLAPPLAPAAKIQKKAPHVVKEAHRVAPSRESKALELGDHPGEAEAFRRMQLRDEHGRIPEDGLVRAKLHADSMRAAKKRAAAERTIDAAAGGIDNKTWTWLGPGNIGGRIRSIAMNPANTSVWLAGSAGGGIWKTTDAGASWNPLNDFMANLAVTSLVMQPGNPSTIYAGTGEGFNNVDAIQGAGIFKSTDGGATWNQLSSTAGKNFLYVNRLAISTDGKVLLAATLLGIFKSTDGGATFAMTSSTSDNIGFLDVAFHPTDSNKAVASGYGPTRYSTDGGSTWNIANWPTQFSRVEMAYAPSAPATVYAVADVASGTLYKSTDGGANFTPVSTPGHLGDQGWYANAMWVDPTNANNIVVGGLDLWRSANGGASWGKISDWTLSPKSAHADHHAIVSAPNFNGSTVKTVIFGNDGGLYSTADVYQVGSDSSHMSGWTVQNHNLGATQFYGAAMNSSGTILAGAQDNGILRYTPSGGVQNYTKMTGGAGGGPGPGDGGYVAVDPADPNFFYGEAYDLQLVRSADGGQSMDRTIYNGIADANNRNINFISPFILDPNNSNTMLAGGFQLWRSKNVKTGMPPLWTSIKPATGSVRGINAISAIAVAAGSSDLCYVGQDNGALYKSTNCTNTTPGWTRVDGAWPPRMILRVTIDSSNSNRVYATLGGYSNDNLWKSGDGGATWASASGSGVSALPAAPIRDLAIAPTNSSELYAATEVGIFASEDQGITWSVPQDGPANVAVEQLIWSGSNLIAVTHGRGLFSATPNTASCQSVATGTATSTISSGADRKTDAAGGSGLPAGGNWSRKVRPDGTGETWTYNFTIGGDKAGLANSARAGSSGAPSLDLPVAGPSVAAVSETAARVPTPPSPSTGAGGYAPGLTHPPLPGSIQPRFVLDADPREPVSVTARKGRFPRVSADGLGGSRTANALPAGAALTARSGLPANPAHAVLSALDISFGDHASGLVGSQTPLQVRLKLSHPRTDRITIWLASGGHEAILWDRQNQSGPIDLNELVGEEFEGAPLSGLWTLFVSNDDREAAGMLDEFWIAAASNAHTDGASGSPSILPAAASIDIAAQRGYMKTASGGSGSEVTSPALGQTVYFTLDFQIAGTGGAVSFAQRALIDGTTFCSFSTTLAIGNWVSSCNNGWVVTSGSHLLQWDVDYTNLVAETNESNNSAVSGFTPTGLDVAALRSYLRTASGGSGSEVFAPALGQTVFFTADFQINGAGTSVALQQRALLDGASYCSLVSTLGNGSWTSWCNTGWAVTAGSHTIEWDFDYGNLLVETNKGNNTVIDHFAAATSVDVVAERSYLRTQSGGLGIEVGQPAVGQTVYFTLDWSINGTGSAVNVSNRAILDAVVFCSGTANAAPGTSWTSWCNSGWVATAGSHLLQFDLDYSNSVPETVETNNSAVFGFTPSSGATLNMVAQRSYLRTDVGGGGNEVGQPTVGQTVYFYMDWAVTGLGTTGTFSNRAVLDGVTFCSGSTSAAADTSWFTWCTSGWTATAGTHTLRWDLDYTNAVTEINESDNSASLTFGSLSSGPTVDLVAVRAYLANATGSSGVEISSPTVGQTVYLLLDWQVNGTGSGITANQRALLDGTVYCSFSLVVSVQTYTSWCNQGWVVTAGTHTLQWDLDYTGTVAETNENNNSVVKLFATGAVSTLDISALRASLRTAVTGGGSEVPAPTPSQSVFPTMNWQITGSANTLTVTQRAVIDNATICSCSLPAIAGNTYVSSCSQPWPVSNGSHTLRWDLDYNGAITETSKANNSATGTFTTASQAVYTVTTNPAGLSVSVDGVTSTAPATFANWASGSTHTLAATSPQGLNVFSSWSDNGTQSHTITAGGTSTTYTANFTGTQAANYLGYIDSASCSGINGWAADRSRPNVSIVVSLWDGNTQIASTTANGSRGDVGGILGDNGLHGFSIPIPASVANGSAHNLQIRFETSSVQLPGSPVNLTCGITGTNYTGYVDSASCSGINGWAADKSRLNTSITVTLWDGGIQVASVIANGSRGDVGGILGDNGLHGFSIPIPASVANGTAHNLQIRYESSTSQLPGSPTTLTCGQTGNNYTGYVDSASCSGITGWAADKNRLNSSIVVTLWDGGTQVASNTASGSRGDVGGVLGDNGLHGFSIPIPASVANGVAHNLQIRYETSTSQLPGSPLTLTCGQTGTNYTGYVDSASCNGISGWAADKNRLNVPITVTLWDGGTQVASTTANGSRGDVGGLLGDNGFHGFSIPIPASVANGTAHNLQIRYESSTSQLPGSPSTLTCGQTSNNYTGWVDSSSCSGINGWAADKNRLNTPILVTLWDGGTQVASVTANGSRGDVGGLLGDNGLHGFSIPIPSSVANGSTHTLQVRYETSASQLPGSPTNLTCGGSGTPNYTGYVDSLSCSALSGWAADKNALNTSITVQFFDSGTLIGSTVANITRGDVGGLLGDNGLHGFTIGTPTAVRDGNTHTISVRPVGSSVVFSGATTVSGCH